MGNTSSFTCVSELVFSFVSNLFLNRFVSAKEASMLIHVTNALFCVPSSFSTFKALEQ